MIPLATAAVIENLIAAVGIANAFKTRHDFSRCRIPVNFFKGPIGASSEWRVNAISTILVVVQAGGFLTLYENSGLNLLYEMKCKLIFL